MAQILSLHDLRERAEAVLTSRGDAPSSRRVPLDEVVHELEVHRVELEMQNESLRAAYVELECMRDRYRELYDLAPVGYVTLDLAGRIRAVNLEASRLLGEGEAQLVGRPLVGFMPQADADVFHRHLGRVRSSRAHQRCDLVLMTEPARPIRVRVDSSPMFDEAGTPEGFRSVVTHHSYPQAPDLQAVEKLKGELAHELNNVLAGIVACINVARAEETPSERAADYLDRAAEVARGGGDLSERLCALVQGQPSHGSTRPGAEQGGARPRQEHMAEPASSPTREGRGVLVVDDEEQSGRMLVKLLELEGYEAVLAISVEEALRVAEVREGRLVLLTEVHLPETDGVQLVAELRRAWPDLPVVFMSGYPGVPEEATAFVPKPIDLVALTEVIDPLLANDG